MVIAGQIEIFKNNAHRMRYRYFRDPGMFIGQCRKLSGMRWNIPGATGILTLRCQHASRWEQIWTRPHNQSATA